MKTLFFGVLLFCCRLPVYSQGTVTFLNTVPFQTIDPSGGIRRVYNAGSPLDTFTGSQVFGTQWVAELYAGLGSSSLSPVTASSARFTAATSSNKWVWSTFGLYGPLAALVLPSIAANQTATLQVRVWNLNLFPDYEAAVGNGITGASVPFTYKVPDPATSPAPEAFFMEGLQAFALVPEPSVLALSVVAVFACCLLRGRFTIKCRLHQVRALRENPGMKTARRPE